MNTFPEATQGTSNNLRIIARGIFLAVLALVLVACSAIRLAYNQAPSLTYWWIDGYADLNEAQTVQMRRDIDAFFAWHRSSELPGYIARLQQWQRLAQTDSQADQVCAQFEVVRSAYLRMIDRSLEPMARVALTLTPAQLRHIQGKYAKNNQEFEKNYLRVSEEERLDNLMERALDRYETLYGDLTDAQLVLLRERIRQSPFDAQRVNAERLRRQADLLRTLRELQAERGATMASAEVALRRWHDRVMQSPLPGFASYSDSLVRNGCEQFAALHNVTTPEQRAHAVRVLKDYETDLRALTAPH
jgi:aryl-alcohol dehydrogenase-like predicted oxidoreductase